MTPAQVAHIMALVRRIIKASDFSYMGQTPAQETLLEQLEAALREAPQAEPVGCFRCVTPKKCAIYGCCPNTWPSEKATPSAPTAVEPDERRQYFYKVFSCKARDANESDCICWHDEGTGPLIDEPERIKHWRASKGTPL